MKDVVISFHASMGQRDWQNRMLKDLFPEQTVFIEGGSRNDWKPPNYDPDRDKDKPTGYKGFIESTVQYVPRSSGDPNYKANVPSTHKRKSYLKPFIKKWAPAGQIADGENVRVHIIGFSQGCQGVSAFLSTPDIGYIDTAVAIDGLHWQQDTPACRMDSRCWQEQVKHWLQFASFAAFGPPPDARHIPKGSRCCVITNSSIAAPVVPNYLLRKAKEATAYVRDKILSEFVGPYQPPPGGIYNAVHNPPATFGRWTLGPQSGPARTYSQAASEWYAAHENLWLFSYKNQDPQEHQDHVYQSMVVLPLMLEKIVIPRMRARTAGTLLEI